MDQLEKEVADMCGKDPYLEEKMAADEGKAEIRCMQRITALRSRTDLLGSVQAVEERFDQAHNGIQFLNILSAALTQSTRQFTATTAALVKAKKQEFATQAREAAKAKKAAQRAEDKRVKLQQKLQQAEAEAKDDKDDGGLAGPVEKKRRRAPANAQFTENDPLVLSAAWPPEARVDVVETFAAWLHGQSCVFRPGPVQSPSCP